MRRRDSNGPCKACGDERATGMIDPKTGNKSPYCANCHGEKFDGKIPKVTDQAAPPTGTGTVPRQQHGRGKTSS